ncbi:hypothetical protein [Pseudonocardia sp. ICBG601]|uniref:hypothetical protein n=1 Tax=Pseudonocardia sp. ICBG601 TaxID=2846759 RepID=UPI001CF69B6D|nr:hypothetical protein [Pseudonocardia sp. ICBG601]
MPHLDAERVVFRPGLNEELAATAVAGTQLLDAVPGRRHEGVVGWWYGKNPGLDRAADAIRHGTLAGTARLGRRRRDHRRRPVLQVLHRAQLLRADGAVPGDAAARARLGGRGDRAGPARRRAVPRHRALDRPEDRRRRRRRVLHRRPRRAAPRAGRHPGPARHRPRAVRPARRAAAIEAEHDQLTRRLDLARQYARETGLNRVTFTSRDPHLAVLASGTAYATVLRACEDLGLGEAELDALGVRLIRLAMPFPVDADALAGLVEGCAEVLVVEDKVPFLEGHLRDALYGRDHRPTVTGRRAERGRPLLSARGQLGSEDVARALAARLRRRAGPCPPRRPRTWSASHRRSRRGSGWDLLGNRTPYFCSGCPHNTSTRTGDDTLVGVGIGCHAMIALDGEHRGHQIGLTQMGGEGAQWIGLARSPTTAPSSRTSATAPSTTPARSRSAPPSRPGSP